RLERLQISAGKRAIDLEGAYSQHVLIDDIFLWNLGSSVLYIKGNANQIRRIDTEGGFRQNFIKEPGQLMVSGAGNFITDCIIEAGGKARCEASYYIFAPK